MSMYGCKEILRLPLKGVEQVARVQAGVARIRRARQRFQQDCGEYSVANLNPAEPDQSSVQGSGQWENRTDGQVR